MSKLREKLALDKSYLNEASDIQLDMVIFPYLEQVAKQKASEINFPYSDAIIDEIYKSIFTDYSLSLDSTLNDIKGTIDTEATKWQENMKQQGYGQEQNQNIANRR